MCQGCEDFAEYDRAIDAWVAKELPRILAAKPLDHHVLYGSVIPSPTTCAPSTY